MHDKAIVVTRCGRICLGRKEINFSQSSLAQAVGIKEVHDDIWLWGTSIWRPACWNRWKIASVQKC
jgi:hypothetical protein